MPYLPLLTALPVLALAAATAALPVRAQELTDLPPQSYTLDPHHSSVIVRADHLGFSTFTASFDDISAELDLDVNNPGSAALLVTIRAASLDLPDPGAGFLDAMLGDTWFDAETHPEITFRSTAVALTGDDTAEVTGDLTIRGETHPATLSVTFNGGWAKVPYEPVSRLGFSARTTVSRSAYGMDFGLPPEGSTLGVADAVDIWIETEFTGPQAQ